MSNYRRLTFEETERGLHWAHVACSDDWELMEVQDGDGCPKGLYAMAWDCRCDPRDYDYFVKAELVTPDGEPYET